MKNVIITVAIVGTGPTREQNQNLPITPEEIADSAVASYHAGASIAHIHDLYGHGWAFAMVPPTRIACNGVGRGRPSLL